MRRLPSQNVFRSFCQHALEAHGCGLAANIIAIDKRRVSQHCRFLSEILLHLCCLFLNIGSKSLLIDKRRQSVRIRFRQKLDTSSLVKFLKFGYHLRCMHLQLLQTYTGNGKCDLKILAITLYHFKECLQSRHIRTLGNITDATFILVVIIIIMVSTYVKETIAFEMYYLVNLKI